MSPTELAIAVLLLLLTPGPTNSLVLLAGAERGWAAAMRLTPAELAGYLLTILPLTLLGAALQADHAGMQGAVTLVAGIWVAILAKRLWHNPQAGGGGAAVDARAVFVTTSLNPKALIFGLVLLPSPDRLSVNLALFAALVILVAGFWAGIGALLRGGSGQPRALFLLRRLASVWLAVMSVALVARGVGA